MPSSTFQTSSTKKKSLNVSSSISRRRACPTRSTQPLRKSHSIASNASNTSKPPTSAPSRCYTHPPPPHPQPKKLQTHKTADVVAVVVAADVDDVGRSLTRPRPQRHRKRRISKFQTHLSSRAIHRSSESSMKKRLRS